MADIYASHFEYDGVLSRTYNLVIVNVESSRFKGLSGSIQGNTIYNKNNHKRYLISDDYSNSHLSFEVDIITDHERGIEFNQRRRIEKWLFNKSKYSRLYFDIVDDPYGEMFELFHGEQKRLYLNCRFINAEKLEYNGGIVGYRATLESDSPFMWQDTTIKTFHPNLPDRIFDVYVDSDADGYTYPSVNITTGKSGGEISISNYTDNESRVTKFVKMPANTSFVMKGELNYVSNGFYDKFSDRNFIRLMDGQNEIHVSGDVESITFEWNNRRRL